MNLNVLITCLLIGFSFNIQANTHYVGPTQTYASPNALYQAGVVEHGDTILIDAGEYHGNATLAIWNADSLYIKGNGGMAELYADGAYISGKGIWVLKGGDIRVENIHFEGAAVPDKNGAGIRLDGSGLIVRHCAFINNENGILTSNPSTGDIIIEYCEFDQGGHGDGFSHNLYVGNVQSLTYRFNYSHHAKIGHLLKSRARYNFILYNRIMDEQTGYSSRLIDLPNGGFSIIMGNLLMQGPNAENSTLIGYGLEGLFSAAFNELYVVNNTCVNYRLNSGIFVDTEEGSEYCLIANNILAGGGSIHRGGTADIHHNLVVDNVDSVGFVDAVNYDYRLLSNSPAIDYGTMINPVRGHSLQAAYEYVHPNMKEDRQLNSSIDAGAYEFEESTGRNSVHVNSIRVYPNPASDQIYIEGSSGSDHQYFIYNSKGEMLMQGATNKAIDISPLTSGIYLIHLVNEHKQEQLGKFLVN